jgi:hypothetical protein
MMSSNMSQKAIDILEKLEGGMSQESAAVTTVRIDDPVYAVETALTEFVTDSMKEVKQNRDLKQELRDVIMSRVAEANVGQLMNFYTEIQRGETAATATLINPLAAIQQARVQAEVETHQFQTPAAAVEDKLFKKGTKDILQGITQLNQLLEKIQGAQTVDPLITAEVIPNEPSKS